MIIVSTWSNLWVSAKHGVHTAGLAAGTKSRSVSSTQDGKCLCGSMAGSVSSVRINLRSLRLPSVELPSTWIQHWSCVIIILCFGPTRSYQLFIAAVIQMRIMLDRLKSSIGHKKSLFSKIHSQKRAFWYFWKQDLYISRSPARPK